jgi:hypothetical protein
MAQLSEHEDGTAGATAAPGEGTAGATAAHGEEEIRLRAWEISQGEDAGSAEENWERAIDELRADRAQTAKS